MFPPPMAVVPNDATNAAEEPADEEEVDVVVNASIAASHAFR